MTDQGVPASTGTAGTGSTASTADAWWNRVYEGPGGRLPDTPEAAGGAESVDDWFDSVVAAVGLVAPPRPAPKVSLVKPPRAPRPSPAPAPSPSPTPPPASAPPSPAAPAPAAAPHVGSRPPTYSPEPTLLPAAPERLAAYVPDTVLDGAQYPGLTLRAASIRGDRARYRGEPRTDALLLTRFGDAPDGLLLAVLGSRPRATGPDTPPDDSVQRACTQLAEAIGRSRAELAADLRTGARDRLRYGLQRLTAGAAAGLRPAAPDGAGALHCLLVSLDPGATHRAAFGLGPGALYLLRSGHWIDAYAARLLHHPDGPDGAEPAPEPPPFRFRLVPATPGDILLLCTPGLAEPIAEEPAVGHFLATHWSHPHPPGSVDFLRQVQVRAKGHADDRTAVALWAD
jgi:hypothetical protein